MFRSFYDAQPHNALHTNSTKTELSPRKFCTFCAQCVACAITFKTITYKLWLHLIQQVLAPNSNISSVQMRLSQDKWEMSLIALKQMREDDLKFSKGQWALYCYVIKPSDILHQIISHLPWMVGPCFASSMSIEQVLCCSRHYTCLTIEFWMRRDIERKLIVIKL